MKAEIHIRGLKEVRAVVDRAARRLDDLRPWLKAAGMLLLESVDKNFREGGRPPWPPLKDSTIARRRKNSGRPLRDSGILMASATNPRHPDAIWKLERAQLTVGTNVPYAGPQHFGVPGHIPARPFLVAQPEDAVKMGKLLTDMLRKETRR